MGSFIDENGCYGYIRAGYQMSGNHGYHAAEHKSDIEAIFNELYEVKTKALVNELEQAIPKAIEEYGRQVWEQLIRSIVGALQTDVNSEVKIAFDGAANVFYGREAQKYISDNIMNCLLKELDKIKYIKL